MNVWAQHSCWDCWLFLVSCFSIMEVQQSTWRSWSWTCTTMHVYLNLKGSVWVSLLKLMAIKTYFWLEEQQLSIEFTKHFEIHFTSYYNVVMEKDISFYPPDYESEKGYCRDVCSNLYGIFSLPAWTWSSQPCRSGFVQFVDIHIISPDSKYTSQIIEFEKVFFQLAYLLFPN